MVAWDFFIFLLGRVDTLLYVVLINQVHDHLHHDILFFRPTLSYHQREGNKGAVGDALGAVLTVENAVIVHEPKEQGGCNTLVAI